MPHVRRPEGVLHNPWTPSIPRCNGVSIAYLTIFSFSNLAPADYTCSARHCLARWSFMRRLSTFIYFRAVLRRNTTLDVLPRHKLHTTPARPRATLLMLLRTPHLSSRIYALIVCCNFRALAGCIIFGFCTSCLRARNRSLRIFLF